MEEPVKNRAYRSPRRQQSAADTHRKILAASTRLFVERGYVATTMSAIAAEAGVALDTVYASVGRKSALFRYLVEAAISGTGSPVPAQQRAYVQQIHAEPDPGRKLEIYAHAIREIQERAAPLFLAWQQASFVDDDAALLWKEITDRRARNMRNLAAELKATGALRGDLSIDEAADIIWATNWSEFYSLLVLQRGWSPDAFERWLADAWKRLLLEES